MEAVPFYKSPVFLMIVTAFLTRLILIFPHIALWFGLTTETLSAVAAFVVLIVGAAFDVLALRFRKKSQLQPLTLTQSKADAVNGARAALATAVPVIDTVNMRKDLNSAPPVSLHWLTVALAASVLAVLLVGCASAPAIDTCNKKYAVAVKADTSVLQSAFTLLQAGKISKSQFTVVESGTDTVMAGLDTAVALCSTDQAAGDSKLADALTLLSTLQGDLAKLQTGAP
jgi:hypothetical protein